MEGGVGTRNSIFNLRAIMEKASDMLVLFCVAFIDYKKAFDSVQHPKLWKKCSRYWDCFQPQLTLFKTLYKGQQVTLRVDKGMTMTGWLMVGTGLRQGCLI